MSTPIREQLAAIVQRELKKIDAASQMDFLLDEKHLEALEALTRVSKQLLEAPDKPAEEDTTPATAAELADLMKALGGGG
jgi:hypothetical protein